MCFYLVVLPFLYRLLEYVWFFETSNLSGSQYYELFSGQGRGPAENWKISGSSIRKVFDKELHTYVYALEGSPSTCKMTLPIDKRKPLSIVHGFLCLQVFLAQNAEFSFELIVTDSGNNRRRLLFSTTVKEIACDQLMARIPLLSVKNSWTNLAIDLRAFVSELWRDQRYRSLDRVSIGANCRLCRVSTALTEPAEASGGGGGGSNSGGSQRGGGSTATSSSTSIASSAVACPTRLLNPSKLRLAAWQPLQQQQQQQQQQTSSPSSSMASASPSRRRQQHPSNSSNPSSAESNAVSRLQQQPQQQQQRQPQPPLQPRPPPDEPNGRQQQQQQQRSRHHQRRRLRAATTNQQQQQQLSPTPPRRPPPANAQTRVLSAGSAASRARQRVGGGGGGGYSTSEAEPEDDTGNNQKAGNYNNNHVEEDEPGPGTFVFTSPPVTSDQRRGRQRYGPAQPTPQPQPPSLLVSPAASHTRERVSRQSLRLISADEVKAKISKAATSPRPALNLRQYKMTDLSDSFEAQMLQDLKNEATSDAEDDKSPRKRLAKHLHDNSASSSDEDDDTDTLSTYRQKLRVPSPGQHHKMEMMGARVSDETLEQSFNRVLSPPAGAPYATAAVSANAASSAPSDSRGSSQSGGEDRGDLIDLLYDPSLNCYFDPKTYKYYELL